MQKIQEQRQYHLPLSESIAKERARFFMTPALERLRRAILAWRRACPADGGSIYPYGARLVGASCSGKSFFLRDIAGALGQQDNVAIFSLAGTSSTQSGPSEVWDNPNNTMPDVFLLDDAQLCMQPLRLLKAIVRMTAARRPFLLCGTQPHTGWSIGCRDLQTRINALAHFSMPQPDDTTLFSLLRHYLEVRQCHIKECYLRFAFKRLERNYASIHDFARFLEEEAWQTRGRIDYATIERIIDRIPS